MPKPPRKRIPLDIGATPEDDVGPTVKSAKAKPGGRPFKEFIIEKLQARFAKVGATIGTGKELALLHPPAGHVRTGIYGLDALLSEGKGLPLGRFVEIFSPESVGKSALCEYIMGRFKRIGGTLHHLDIEHTRDDAHLASYGIGPDDYVDGQDLPDLEAVWNYARSVVSGLEEANKEHAKRKEAPEPPNLIVLDSLAASPARDEMSEDDHGDSHVGLQARSNAKGCRTTTRAFSAAAAVFLFVNQIRDKIGMTGYGPKTETPGGRALKFAYTIRLKLAKIETIKKGDAAIGHIIEVQAVKNKLAPPFMKTHIVLNYSRGIDRAWSNFLYFQEHGFVIAKGKKGFVWKGEDTDDTFTRQTFAAWGKTHKAAVKAAVKECLAEDIAAVRPDPDDNDGDDLDA